MKRIIALLLAALMCAAVLSGCAADADDGRLSIVTTTFPPYDFARAIAGDYAGITMLMDPGTEPHTFDPTPRDIRTIQNCDIFIYGGGESDAWMDSILASVDTSEMIILSMTSLVDLLEEETQEGMTTDHETENCDDPTHAHAAYDEHVWTSPANAAVIAAAIRDAVCEADPENRTVYEANAAAYIAGIEALSADFSAMIAQAQHKTVIFADRFPFLYFVREFGLDYYAAFPGCAEKTEPGAQTIAHLIEKVKAEKIPAVFYTEFSNQQLADSICEATGAEKMLYHSCHNVSKADFDAGVTYVSLMRKNLENLRGALNG
ncbi:MAG: zinc ABC transporter substrate-binding protein [Ruminococcaceae bacterium]|nr:zinc ABC transporter substrate-binding protein [Oscillospiraceae bacterium]